jgi:hypothetical protein
MKFMFMIYHDEHVLDALPEGEMQTLIDSALDYDEELRQSGHYIVSNALQPARTARTIRVHAGKIATTDGPLPRRRSSWAASSDVPDMDEACEVASRFPRARRDHRSPPGSRADALLAHGGRPRCRRTMAMTVDALTIVPHRCRMLAGGARSRLCGRRHRR